MESSEELKNLNKKLSNDIAISIEHIDKEESNCILTKSKKKLNDIINRYIDKEKD